VSQVVNHILGLIRFSYPAIGAFARSGTAPADAAAFLYDPARLDRRFHLLENLCLPSMLAQDDANFDLGVLVGDDLPAPFRARLDAALRPMPRARVIALPPLPHYDATQRAFAAMRPDTASHITTFRLDDDDALCRSYIATLRRMTDGLIPLRAAKAPFAIAFNRGFFLERGDGGNRVYDVIEKLPPASGCAMTAHAAHRDNVYRRNHRLLPQFMTVFSDADTPAFIRSIHADNDSTPFASGQSARMKPEKLDAALRAGFPFTLDSLQAL
jgi:Putative rhamnosyl transferase